MIDLRMQRLADVLVNYGLEVQPGQWIQIRGESATLPLIRQVHAEVIRAGGNPTLIVDDAFTVRTLLKEGTDDQLRWLDPIYDLFGANGDGLINILGTNNARAMANLDPHRNQIRQMARSSYSQTLMQRSAEGNFRVAITQYPTQAAAQEANMSLEEYQDFLYAACFCHHENPVAQWQRMNAMQQHKIDWLKNRREIVLNGPDIEMQFSIEGRSYLNGDGRLNMPDGEIYTSPVENSVSGWVRFKYPLIVSEQAISGIELRFESGQVVEARAEQNEPLLLAQLQVDSGARILGEFGIGTNYDIQQFTGNILFDEKIGGTIHLALGLGYPAAGGKNRSAVHWDLICDMRHDSEIRVDGELFYKDGHFMV